MDFTKNFVRSKNPCAEGFRWYLRHHRNGSDYQQVLDDLVRDGRIDDACWLLEKVGPTHTVLQLDALECDAIVHAGTLEVRGGISVDSVLRAGGAIRCGGPVRAGKDIVAGDDLRAAGGLNCGGDVACGGTLVADWHVLAGGNLRAADVKVAGDLQCEASMTVAGRAHVKGNLAVGGDCSASALGVRGHAQVGGSLRTAQGLICGEGLACGRHLDAGWGIRAGGHIHAGGAIRAGEGVECAGTLSAGEGYGVFAGLCVQHDDWATSARVAAAHRPARLMSGCWTGRDGAACAHCKPHALEPTSPGVTFPPVDSPTPRSSSHCQP